MSEPERLEQDFCVWDAAEREFVVGVVGTGPGFVSILDIIENEQYQEFIPPLRLRAVAEPGANPRRLERARRMGVVVYPTFREMMAAQPEINLVVELLGSRAKLRQFRSELPDDVSLIDHSAAIFLCGLHNMLQSSTHCQLNLDRHKALLTAIIDEVRDDILLLDKEGRVVDLNRNVAERTGKDKSELVGLPCFRVQTMDDGSPFCPGWSEDCPFQATLASGQPAEALFTRVNAEGRLRYFRVYAYPILNEFGNMTHILVMRRDITRRTNQERLRQQAEKMAVVGEMAMYLAHEIRNPLFAISGFTRSLRESKNLSDKEKEKLGIIAEEAKRLDALLTSIISFSRRGDGQIGAVDLNRAVGETLDIMRISHSNRGYRFVLDTDPNIPLVKGEGERIKQCLVDLLFNAMEAMEGGGVIGVRTALDHDKVILDITDAGRGMSNEDLERAFSPFHSTKGGGYGLGLAMVKKIVEEYGGSASIGSRLGRGTTVTLTFAPVLASDDDAGTSRSGTSN